MKNFKIFSSSAGSGKTYTLTKEYLKLALSEDESGYFKRILAITFTNEAANEMKARILQALQVFGNPAAAPAGKEKSYQLLLEAVVSEINEKYPQRKVSEAQIQQRAAAMFSRIIHEYSDFSVGTIDSFTNRVVSAFTQELDLPYNYEIDLNAKEALQQAVERMLEKVGSSPQESHLSNTLEEFILEKAEEGGSFRYLPDDLSEFGTSLLNEKVFESVKALSGLELKDFERIREQVRERIEVARTQILAEAQVCADALGPLTPQDFTEGSRGIGGYFEALLKKEEDKLLDEATPTVFKTLELSDWANKKTRHGVAINALQEVFRGAFERVEAHKSSALLLEAIYKHLHKVSVLNEIDRELKALKNESNTVHLSDFNKSIVQIVLNEPVPFIYERLGEKYNHILIDEFQDTSALQWNNLMPLIENSLGYGHLNLLVGDAKQAIYGWRGGDMEQIVHLAKNRLRRLVDREKNDEMGLLEQRYHTLQQYLSPQQLRVNYRSHAEIIAFNNAFFRSTADLYSRDKPLLAEVYDEQFQQEIPPTASTGGHVQLRFVDRQAPQGQPEGIKTPTQQYQENMLAALLSLIEEAQAAGYSYRDIAVLVRRNGEGKRIAAFLAERGYPIISSDSLLLQLSEGVRFVLSFLQVLHKPTSALLRYECLQLFHLYVLRKLPDEAQESTLQEVSHEKSLKNFYQYFVRAGYECPFARLPHLGLYEMAEQLIQVFGLRSLPRQADYLYRLLDIMLDFGLKQSNHLADFLEYWESKKNKLSISAPKSWNALTVTTIHKAKGLEYPVVLLAFADWELGSSNPKNLFWADLSAIRPNVEALHDLPLISSPLSHHKNINRTPLRTQYEAETTRLFVENLNILYVALTRPTDRLYILTEHAKFASSSRQTVSLLLYHFLLAGQHWNDEEQNYVLHAGVMAPNRGAENTVQTLLLEEVRPADWRKKIWQLRTFHESIFDAEHFDKKQEFYNKMIYVLTQAKDSTQTHTWLRRLLGEGKTDKKEMEAIDKELQLLFQEPLIGACFEVGVQIMAEKQILHQTNTPTRPPDRIIVEQERITLMLFRSGKPKKEDNSTFKKYDALLRKMGYSDIRKVTVDVAQKTAQLLE